MPKVPKVPDDEIIHMDDINCITAKFLPMFIVVVRSNAGDQNIADLIFARTTHYSGIAIYATCKVMPGVIVADGDDGGIYLTQRVFYLRRKDVSNQGNILATYL